MKPALHGRDRYFARLSYHQPAGMTLDRGARKTRDFVITNFGTVVKIVGKASQATARDNRHWRLHIRVGANQTRGFLSALFDFSFTSFVTTRIIKVLYVLILVLVSLVALIYTIIAFRLSMGFGLLVLIIGDPLYIIIVMAFWRLLLEAFVVVFRIAEDIRALRERAGR